MKVAGIIPARYGSSRLPGKPLMEICGKPMIWWVYHRCEEISSLDQIWVATDDERILGTCRKEGIPAVMTSPHHATAANRLWEAARQIPADFYIQLNGDEPLLSPHAVAAAIPQARIPLDREYGTNIITPIYDPVQVLDDSNIKVVFDENFRALYMSRRPIPHPFGSLDVIYYKHVGIIGYNRKMLDFYAASEPGRLERIEGIDTLRFLDYGKELQLIPVEHLESLSVDTGKDLERVRVMIHKKLQGDDKLSKFEKTD